METNLQIEECTLAVTVLGVIAGVHVIASIVLFICIIWCACCCRKSQVQPLSPKSNCHSPNQDSCKISSPTLDERELKHLRIVSQLEARRLQTISESTLMTSENDQVTTTSIESSSTPFISSQSDIKVLQTGDDGQGSPVLRNGDSRNGISNDSCGNRDNVSHSTVPNEKRQIERAVSLDSRSKTLTVGKPLTRRTDSTRPLLGASMSDFGGSVSEDIGASYTSLPGETPTMPTMRVLTRRVNSRKRLTGSERSLVGIGEDYERSNTLPRAHRLPPFTSPRPQSTQPLPPLQTLSENSTLITESVTNLSSSTVNSPRPRLLSSDSTTSSLARLSLNLADDLGLQEKLSS